MTIIAHKKITPNTRETDSEIFESDGFLKEIESFLTQEKGIEKPLENIWRLDLSVGLRLLPKFHEVARKYHVRLAALVAEESTISALL